MIEQVMSTTSVQNALYDYLIITIEDFLDNYQPLVNFYNSRGIRTRMVTVEAIERDEIGMDAQEKIRNFIKNEYQTNGIQTVLMAGDADDDKTGDWHLNG